MIALILTLAVFGFIAWAILQIPMPSPFRNIILGLICLVLVIYVLQMVGVHTGFPAVRLR